MRRLGLIGTPCRIALRRIRARPLPVFLLAGAFAAAAGLIGWSGFSATLAQEDNVRIHLGELGPARGAFRVVNFTTAGERDQDAGAIAAGVANLRDLTGPAHRVRLWHPVAPQNESGVQIVVPTDFRDIVVRTGRAPRGCLGGACEMVALSGQIRLGELIRLGPGIRLRVVGVGSLRPAALGTAGSLLGRKALAGPSLDPALQRLLGSVGSTVVTSAPLEPAAVHGFALRATIERLREETVRLDTVDESGIVRASAPLPFLSRLADRGEAAHERLLLVSGEAAGLIVAFAAFAARIRRRESVLLEDQLATLGASRAQIWLARVVQAVVPSVMGTALALAGLRVAAELVADKRGFPAAFVAAAVPAGALYAIAALALAGSVLLVGAFAPRPQGQKVGPLELAALASLALVGWQAAATGALDPGRVAGSGSNPILLLLPALAFFATAVLFLRLLPPALRLSERAVRRAPFAVRLAFLSAARRPAESAAATTFLAVALGGALFALDYRATLDGQARAQAGFAVGAAWRVTERDRSNPGGPTSVAPLTRFARVSAERPTPVLRLEARLVNADTEAQPLPVDILGLPAGRLGAVRGWRKDFSPMSRDEIADRLRPRLVRLGGPRIAPDARALQVWAQAETERPRIAILHFLLPGQSFAYLPLGAVSGRWSLLRARIPTSLRGAELVGIEFQPTFVPLTRAPDLAGAIRLGPVAELRAGIWRPLASQAGWIAAPPSTPSASGGFVTRVAFAHAPVTHGLRFDLNGTLLPLIRPRFSIPHPLPALVGPSIAAAAVDGITTLDLDGMPLRVRAVARASLFPTVTANRSAFVVVDYDTLFAALNADQPGRAMPSEAWFFAPQRSSFESRLELPPFQGARAFNEQQVRTRLLRDPLAAGTRDVLGVAGVAAAVLALLGLLLATRSMLTSEAPLLAEYEALGVPPTTLVRASQLRLAAGCAFGVAAGLAGALLALRLIGAFVAVTGTGGRPLPPIVPAVSWTGTGILLALLAGLGIVGVSFLARRTLGESTAVRLRA